ncbi:MAG: PDZ domain-containing protein [Halobacteria archaeon]|nr:PDZ domain-containing protein [Halobacteria archaeon]
MPMKSGHSLRCRLSRRFALWLAPIILAMYATSMQPGQAMEQVSERHSHTDSGHSHGDALMQATDTPVLDLRAAARLEDIIPELDDMQVILVGETHDRYDHHLTQLEIIRRLHARNPRLVIGMEAFQQPFQDILDGYIEGELDEQELLRGTEYYRRWKYDFRHYAPILAYAREHALPVVALNLPVELTDKVGRVGIDGLTEPERDQLPAAIDHSDTAYAERLRGIYHQHPETEGRGFEGFLEVQLIWDEGMAERAAEYLEAHPDYRMVLLAGTGHLAYGSGIPQRLQRRLGGGMAIILNDWQRQLKPGLADYLLLPQQQSLPPAGKFGALLEEHEDELLIKHCLADSPCEQAGIRPGDRILSINDLPVNDLADLRLIMWNLKPGDSITLALKRRRLLGDAQALSHEMVLY